MCNRIDNYGLSILEVSNELHAEIVEKIYYYAEEIVGSPKNSTI